MLIGLRVVGTGGPGVLELVKALALVFCLTLPAAAQFTGLSATEDGSSLYFSSNLRLRGTTQLFTDKVFRLDAAGPGLFAMQDPGEPIGWTTLNFGELEAPQVSSDGSVVAYTGTRGCYGGSGCLDVQTAQGAVADRSGNVLLSEIGYVNISPSGRFALFFARNTFAHIATPAELVDRNTGVHTMVPYGIGSAARRRVADDGTVALFTGGAIHLWRTDGDIVLQGLSIAANPSWAEPILFISRDAQRLVYQTASGLAAYDRATSTESAASSGEFRSVSASDDCRVVAYVSSDDSQVYLAFVARRLTHEADGITEVALSGDGTVAFAATGQGRLLRIDVATGDVAELVPRSPAITSLTPVSPGSAVRLQGTGLAAPEDATASVRVRIGGLDAPVQSAAAGEVWVQTPWEVAVQDAATFEYISGDSPFETGPGTVAVPAVSPYCFTASDANGFYCIAVHQDWSGLVTRDSPAVAGEVITMYFTGLGPVSPVVATGAAGPVDPLARVTGALSCQFWDGGPNDARIFFAGLAPTMVGIYQVSLEVPTGLRFYNPGVTCGFSPDTGFSVGSTFVKTTESE